MNKGNGNERASLHYTAGRLSISRRLLQNCLLVCACFAVLSCAVKVFAQDNPVFNQVRQLPDLGACPTSGTPNPDLQKALSSAVAEARRQVKNLVNLAQQAKDSGLLPADKIKELSQSAKAMDDAINKGDDCTSARAFAQLPAPAGPAQAGGTSPVEKPQTIRDKITVDQASLDFGHQAMQTASDSKAVVVTNKTGASQNFQLLTVLGQPRDFKVTGCQNTIDNNDHCTFNVVFAPFPSNHLKLQETFIAVVPSNEKDSFESSRAKLAAIGNAAEEAEDQWRAAMRCKDHPNSECPRTKDQAAGQPQQPGQTATAEQRWDDLKARLCWKVNDNFDKGCRHLTLPEKDLMAAARWREYRHQRDEESRALENLQAEFNVLKLNAVADHWKFPFTRAVVGADLSAPSSRTLKQSYFIDFDLLAPFPGIKRNQDPLENRVFFWLNPRITSLPQATNFSTISSINETGSFFDTNQTIDKIAQGFDVNGGIDIALIKPRDGVPWWASYANTQAKLAPSFIIGGGMSTPFSTDSTQVTSAVTQAICDAFAAPAAQQFSIGTSNSPQGAEGLRCTFNDPNSPTNPQKSPLIQVQNPSNNPDPNKGVRSFIEFYQQDRSRFFRRYYLGLRLKTYFFSPDVHSYCQPFENRKLDEGDCAAPYDIFPGIIDLTVGQDESVTGGRTVGLVGRVDAVYPLPWFKGMHVFGSMYTRFHGANKTGPPFSSYTIVNPTNGAANDLNTFRFALQPLDRDYFRIGVGVDLIQVFKKTGQPEKNAPQAPASLPKTSGTS